MLFQTLALASGVGLAAAVSDYSRVCSSENTGSSFSAVTDIYNSAGSCVKTCGTDYTYGVLQDNQCWCTTSLPASTVNVSECNESCPGYPLEDCGSKASNLFTYFNVNNDTDAIIGASQTAPYTGSVSWTGSVSATALSTVASSSATSTGSANATVTSAAASSSVANSTASSSYSSANASSTGYAGAANKGMSFSMSATGLILVAGVALFL